MHYMSLLWLFQWRNHTVQGPFLISVLELFREGVYVLISFYLSSDSPLGFYVECLYTRHP